MMCKRKQKGLFRRKCAILLSVVMVLTMTPISVMTQEKTAQAAATKEALKFLKGNWVTVGQSGGTVVVFTKKYAKWYSLWNKSYTDITNKKKYTGRTKIVSTKKKGKEWYIKLKSGNCYIGEGDSLLCRYKDSNGDWQTSYSSSLQRTSEKLY